MRVPTGIQLLAESIVSNPLKHPALRATISAIAALIAACSSVQRAPPTPKPGPAQSVPEPAPAPLPPVTSAAPISAPSVSYASSALAYRRDAASHLYARNAERIYKGIMQPNLYAIGVLDVDIDRRGQVVGLSWRRAPSHAPEVMAEIVRTVRQAAPYPVPSRLGRVTYTDIWLWDKSGQFQLDTLTEGQM